MSSLHRVILDTDIGSDVDDLLALALILGTPSIDLIGVTTVYGDTLLRARIAKRAARLAGRDIPVIAGESQPLSGRDVWWAGHEGALYDELESETIDGQDAVAYLVETVLADPGSIDLIAIGPLTNIAAAIRRDSRFASAVRHLWIMGGAFTTDEPEHNFRSDTTAAEVVFGSGIPTTVSGLEVTRQVTIDRDSLARIAGSGNLGALIDAEVRQWWEFWSTEWNVPHDPVTVLTMTDPDLFRFSGPGAVSIHGEAEDAGVSRFAPGSGSVRIAEQLDADGVADKIVLGIVAASPLARRGAGE
ncbi:nucleoside hydrolase [Microbacterium sp. NPDC019599]|uniref:nucleoside hydrolase n=1 Tax=Microbacterium sp. NPDC019599 TaxID=3154690 RepID=UPI0033BFCD51